MKQEVVLTTFSTPNFEQQQRGLVASALKNGATRTSTWRQSDLKKTCFYERNKAILSSKRGSGFWLWKPYIIARELELVPEGSFVIYYDCGRPERPHRISRPLEILTDWVKDNTDGMLPGLYIPEYGRNSRWTKGECFHLLGCDDQYYKDHCQVQATFSVWQRHEKSINFVHEWLSWGQYAQAICDEYVDSTIPNSSDFLQHRHDQSILTLLVLKHGLQCFGRPDTYLSGNKDINNLIDRIEHRFMAVKMRNITRRIESRLRREFIIKERSPFDRVSFNQQLDMTGVVRGR